MSLDGCESCNIVASYRLGFDSRCLVNSPKEMLYIFVKL